MQNPRNCLKADDIVKVKQLGKTHFKQRVFSYQKIRSASPSIFFEKKFARTPNTHTYYHPPSPLPLSFPVRCKKVNNRDSGQSHHNCSYLKKSLSRGASEARQKARDIQDIRSDLVRRKYILFGSDTCCLVLLHTSAYP